MRGGGASRRGLNRAETAPGAKKYRGVVSDVDSDAIAWLGPWVASETLAFEMAVSEERALGCGFLGEVVRRGRA
jgi:hypothetical protein